MTEGTNTKYMLTDGLGSVTAVINTTAPGMDFIQYDVYGNTAEPLTIPYGFAGMRYVEGFDGYLTPNRVYSPKLGRWLQPDPLGITPNPHTGNVYSPLKQYSDGMNLYAYVGNEPVNNLDVWGLEFDLIPPSPGNPDGSYVPSIPAPSQNIENTLKSICDKYEYCGKCRKTQCYNDAKQIAKSYYDKMSEWIKKRDDDWRKGISDGSGRFPFPGRYNSCDEYSGATIGFGLGTGCFSFKQAFDKKSFMGGHQYIGVFHACNDTNHSDANLDPWIFGDWYHAPRIVPGKGCDSWQ